MVTPRQEELSRTPAFSEGRPSSSSIEPSFTLRPAFATIDDSGAPAPPSIPRSLPVTPSSLLRSLEEQQRLQEATGPSSMPSPEPSPSPERDVPDISIWRRPVIPRLEREHDINWYLGNFSAIPVEWVPLEIWIPHIARWEAAFEFFRGLPEYLAEKDWDLKPQLGTFP